MDMILLWIVLPALVHGWSCSGWNGSLPGQPGLQLLAHEATPPAQMLMLLRTTQSGLRAADFVVREDGILIEPGQTILNDEGVAIVMHLACVAPAISMLTVVC